MADSSALLSTMAGAGATLVAIIGGFLVSRYVSLDSEQQGAKRKLAEVSESLDAARRERDVLRTDRAFAFAREAVESERILKMLCREQTYIQAASGEESPPPEAPFEDIIRRIGDITQIDELVLEEVVRQTRKYVRAALIALEPKAEQYMRSARNAEHIPHWSDVRVVLNLRVPDAALPSWIFVWEEWFLPTAIKRVEKRLEDEAREDFPRIYVRTPANLLIRHSEWDSFVAGRSIGGDLDLSKSDDQIKALEIERTFASRAYEAIGKPTGLRSGLIVLTLLAVLQIVPPMLYLAPTPTTLTTREAIGLLMAFATGLFLLLGYLFGYASRLGLVRRSQNVAPPPVPPAPDRTLLER